MKVTGGLGSRVQKQDGAEGWTGVYAFPEGHRVYHDAVPNSYTNFRENWILCRRTRPMVPCPENTPLPNRRISKEQRAKRLSIYLRPWTLSRKMRTEDVPHLTELAGITVSTDKHPDDDPMGAASRSQSFRGEWKKYLTQVWPHSKRCVQSFMLTCLAEGRGGDNDEDNNRAKGSALVCKLTVGQVHEAIAFRTPGMTPTLPPNRSWRQPSGRPS